MRKILAILLFLCMLFSLTALAEGGPNGGGTPPGGSPGEGEGGGFGGNTAPGGSISSFEYAATTEITSADEHADQT